MALLKECVTSVLRCVDRIGGSIRRCETVQPNILYAFYDLAVSPATFNIVEFLMPAEIERRRTGCESLHLVIVPGPDEGFRADNFDTGYDNENKRWRLRNILVPCSWMLPSCKYVTVCANREEASAIYRSMSQHVFPTGYTVKYPIAKYGAKHFAAIFAEAGSIPSVEVSPTATAFVREWLRSVAGERKVISVTLRESGYEIERNSQFQHWGRFARALDPGRYCPVVVRDTEKAFSPLPQELEGLPFFGEAAWNLELRAALYEESYLNMGVNNGPLILCIMNQRSRYVLFKCLAPACGIDEAHWLHINGIRAGYDLPWATPYQKVVWKDDTYDVLMQAFEEMCARIEDHAELPRED